MKKRSNGILKFENSNSESVRVESWESGESRHVIVHYQFRGRPESSASELIAFVTDSWIENYTGWNAGNYLSVSDTN